MFFGLVGYATSSLKVLRLLVNHLDGASSASTSGALSASASGEHICSPAARRCTRAEAGIVNLHPGPRAAFGILRQAHQMSARFDAIQEHISTAKVFSFNFRSLSIGRRILPLLCIQFWGTHDMASTIHEHEFHVLWEFES